MKPTRGKSICKQLKALRHSIAEENGIPLEQRECTYEGPCRGTCPRCEAEVKYLERALAHRLKLGKAATVAGLSLSLAACSNGGSAPQGTVLTVGDTAQTKADTLLPDAPLSEGIQEFDEEAIVGIMGGTPPPPPPPYEEDTAAIVDDYEYEVGEVAADFQVVEYEPEFPGGMGALHAFLKENIRYPEAARKNRIEGKVYVTFIVEKDGSITNAKLLRDIGGGCGAEAVRAVKTMPRWIPAKQRGETVRCQFNLPVTFTLTEEEREQAKKQ